MDDFKVDMPDKNLKITYVEMWKNREIIKKLEYFIERYSDNININVISETKEFLEMIDKRIEE